MLPECAAFGTVTSRPCEPLRRCAAGEALEIRAPRECGNATTMPAARPLPAISRMPWVETSCGLVVQLLTGMHFTLVIRTVFTCELAAGAGLLAGALAVGVSPGAPCSAGVSRARHRLGLRQHRTAAKWLPR